MQPALLLLAIRRRLIITIILLLIIAQQRRILSTPQILLQPALALRVYISLAAEQTKEYREQDKRVRGGPYHERDPDAEVVNIEDLRRNR